MNTSDSTRIVGRPVAFWFVAGVVALFMAAVALSGSTSERASAGALSPVIGDVDCDENVNSEDAALVLQSAAGLLHVLRCPGNAYVDGDSVISSIDATLILQYTAGLLDHLPPRFTLTGTVVLVHGLEADCLALQTDAFTWVLWDPTGLSVGDRVAATGFIDPYASFCGISPLFHNISVIHIP